MYGKLEQLRYVNHLGEELTFGRDGLYVNQSDIHDYSWTVTSNKIKITDIQRGMRSITLPVRVACTAEGMAMRNRLYEIPERDVVNGRYGKLWVGDYYLECFITASKKQNYSIMDNYMAVTLTVTTDRPMWIRENVYRLNAYESSQEASEFLDYPYGFPYDFFSGASTSRPINNEGIGSAHYKLLFFGNATNPYVYIDGVVIGVNATIESDQYICINSLDHTVNLVANNGDITNLYNNRIKSNTSIFEKIPEGLHYLVWPGVYGVELTIYEERSEPLWI